jgi:hypothetical protein
MNGVLLLLAGGNGVARRLCQFPGGLSPSTTSFTRVRFGAFSTGNAFEVVIPRAFCMTAGTGFMLRLTRFLWHNDNLLPGNQNKISW